MKASWAQVAELHWKSIGDISSSPFSLFKILLSNPEVEWFYEELQDLLELTPKKDVLFIIGDWNAKVESQETAGVTCKFGLGIQNE